MWRFETAIVAVDAGQDRSGVERRRIGRPRDDRVVDHLFNQIELAQAVGQGKVRNVFAARLIAIARILHAERRVAERRQGVDYRWL
jgi:hypothetical protein